MAMPVRKTKVQQFKSWSPTRLNDYERCPLYAKLKHLDKLCTLCFKGKIMGGYDSPATCDTCSETIVKSEALERGTEIGKTLEDYCGGKPKAKLHTDIRHPKVKEIAKTFREQAPEEAAKPTPDEPFISFATEMMLQLDRNWKFVGTEWTPDTWLIVKLDLFAALPPAAKVIDWKTGGIDKRTGDIKKKDDKGYQDQLSLYNTAVLSAFPEIEVVDSSLVFTDCGPRFNPVVKGPSLEREGLKAAQVKWTARALPLLRDDTFAPRANGLCNYCDFRKAKGGPCKF